MKRLVDLQTQQDFDELAEILDKISDSNIIGTLKQVITRSDGTFNYADIRQSVADTKVVVQLNSKYLYITAQNVRRVDVRRLKEMWNTVLMRGTQQFSKGQANDYVMTVDIMKNELQKGFVYCITAAQPIFVSGDGDNDLTFTFELENARCAKEEVSQYDVDYEAAIREESGDSVYTPDNYDDDEEQDDGFDENDELLNNNDIL